MGRDGASPVQLLCFVIYWNAEYMGARARTGTEPTLGGALGGNKREQPSPPSFRIRDVSIFIKRGGATAEKYSSLSRPRESRTT